MSCPPSPSPLSPPAASWGAAALKASLSVLIGLLLMGGGAAANPLAPDAPALEPSRAEAEGQVSARPRSQSSENTSRSDEDAARSTERLEAALRCSDALLRDAPGARAPATFEDAPLPRLYTRLDRLELPGADEAERERLLLERLAPLWGGFQLEERGARRSAGRRSVRYRALLAGRPVWDHQVALTFSNTGALLTLNTDLMPAPPLARARRSVDALREAAEQLLGAEGQLLARPPRWGIHLTPRHAIEAIEFIAIVPSEGPLRLRLDGRDGRPLARLRMTRSLQLPLPRPAPLPRLPLQAPEQLPRRLPRLPLPTPSLLERGEVSDAVGGAQ